MTIIECASGDGALVVKGGRCQGTEPSLKSPGVDERTNVRGVVIVAFLIDAHTVCNLQQKLRISRQRRAHVRQASGHDD